MGVVWRARDELLDREVAVKEVLVGEALGEEERANAYQRTLREAKTAARLSHRGVVTVYDVAEEDGRPWIIMELVNASSLDQVIADSGPLSPRRAGLMGQQLLAALASAHAAGVLHRDVKPSNVLLAADDRAVLTDFGIAEFQGDPRLTQTGMVMGSPGFTAPERIRGGAATPASDLWSLGATLYTAVEGQGPYEQRGGAITTMSAIINEDAPTASSAGPLGGVIAALLRREPGSRPDAITAAGMIADIVPLLPDKRTGRTPTQVSVVGGARGAGAGAGPGAAAAAAGGGNSAGAAGGFAGSFGGGAGAFPVRPAAFAGEDHAGLAGAGLAGAGLAGAGLAGAGLPEPGLAEAGLAEAGFAGAGLAEAGFPGAAGGGAGVLGGSEAPTAVSPVDGVQAAYAPPRTEPSKPAVPPPPDSPLSSPLPPAGPRFEAGLDARRGAPDPPTTPQQAFAHPASCPAPAGYQMPDEPAGTPATPARQRGRGGWKVGLAAVAVIAAAVGGGVAAFAIRHNHASPPAKATGVSPTPPGPLTEINQPVLAALPAGYTRETVTPADAGTQAGYTIGVPSGWQPVRRSSLDTIFYAPGDTRYLQIDLTTHTYDDMLVEARFIKATSLNEGRFPGYQQITLRRAGIRGNAGAIWKFTWQDRTGIRMEAEDLLFIAKTAAGPQSYALYMSAPAASWNASLPAFGSEMRTFQTVTAS